MNEKGNFSFVITFFIIAIGLSFMFLLLAPSLQKYNIAIFRAAEPMLQDMNTQAGLI